ncbi:MAG: hypothetical protein GX765_02515 [Candidatus Moranbacteria bacterium]|nr:hypothetical protein [Candidatus Moranbacteria bacterium]
MDKIEEIRQKPENEKIRYVWGMVTVCMIIIFFVWIFSLQDLMDNDQDKINSGSEILGDMEKLEKTEISGEQMNQSEQMNPSIQP